MANNVKQFHLIFYLAHLFSKENFRRGSNNIININTKYNHAKYIHDPTKELRHNSNGCKPLQDESTNLILTLWRDNYFLNFKNLDPLAMAYLNYFRISVQLQGMVPYLLPW
jgi:hypothetical protein